MLTLDLRRDHLGVPGDDLGMLGGTLISTVDRSPWGDLHVDSR